MNMLRFATNGSVGGTMAGRQQIEDTPRKQFLRQNGLQRDVFANPVAEQEYGFSSRPDPVIHDDRQQGRMADALADRERWIHNLFPNQYAPRADNTPTQLAAGVNGHVIEATAQPPLKPTFSALSYFVDPLYAHRSQGSIFSDLRQPQHTFLFGRPGEGKTTTRLALEAHVRAQPQETLMVTYEPGRVGPTVTLDDHLSRLVCEVAVDLFVQVVEQFAYRSRPPGKQQTAGILWLLPFGGQPLARVLDRLAHGDELSPIWGFADLWRYLDRPVVRPVVRTERLQEWLKSLSMSLQKAKPGTHPMPRKRWRQAVGIVRRWGFRQVYVAVDGVDTWQRTPADMMAVLDELLEYAPELARQHVYLRGFLPLELRPAVEQTLTAGRLQADGWRTLLLRWGDERLTALLFARLLAGGGPALSIADLFEAEFTKEIDSALIAAAKKSPRRLLTSIDQLINVHVGHEPLERSITYDEWDKALKRTDSLLVTSTTS